MSKGWDESAARDVLARNAPSQAALPLGTLKRWQEGDASFQSEKPEPPAQPRDLGPQTSGQNHKTGLQPDAEGWVTLVVPGEPVAKERARVIAGKAKAIGERPVGRAYTPDRTANQEKLIATLALAAGMQKIPAPTPVEMECHFYRSTLRVFDGTNGAKLVEDALNPIYRKRKPTDPPGKTPKARVMVRPGIAYDDDTQITVGHQYKHVDRHNPRTVIRLRKAVE